MKSVCNLVCFSGCVTTIQANSTAQLNIVREQLDAANVELSRLRQLDAVTAMQLNSDLEQQLVASQTSHSTLTGLLQQTNKSALSGFMSGVYVKYRDGVAVPRGVASNQGRLVSLSSVNGPSVEWTVTFPSSTKSRLVLEHLLEVDLQPTVFSAPVPSQPPASSASRASAPLRAGTSVHEAVNRARAAQTRALPPLQSRGGITLPCAQR